jgi:hypothetical protein
MMLAKEDFLKDVGLLFVFMVVTSKLDTKVSCSLLLGLMQMTVFFQLEWVFVR